MDRRNLIACQPCAKAKAKCDKQLPTCSRCLHKRLKCEQRSPRHYVENSSLPQDQINNAAPRPDTISNSNHGLPTITPIGVPPIYNPLPVTGSFHWQPQSLLSESPCPGDLAVTSALELDVLMDSDFSWNEFEAILPSTQEALDQSGPVSLALETPSIQSAFPGAPINDPTRSAPSGLLDEDLPCFRCNPMRHQRINPRVGGEYLQKLEETLNNQSVWTGPGFFRPQLNHTAMTVAPIQSNLRDKLMVISQSFLSKARDVHRTIGESDSMSTGASLPKSSLTGFFILPPSQVLEDFLRTYAARVEPYMPSFPSSSIDLTTPMTSTDDKPTILLILLMMAHGVMGKAEPRARYVAAGLVEICRISISDILEKDVQKASEPMMLRCALLYLNAAAWSGFKWHADLSAAHAHKYGSIVRHAGLLDMRDPPLAGIDPTTATEVMWVTWRYREFLNRLAYSWVTFDQEMSLFHDCQPNFEIDDCNALVPCNDGLWIARSIGSWTKNLQEIYQHNLQAVLLGRSLAQLFNLLMTDELSSANATLTSIELRLLLQPIQTLIYHMNKSLHYSFHSGSQYLPQRLSSRFEEVQELLTRWYSISSRSALFKELGIYDYSKMIMFHLISLNACTYLPDIEKLARGDISPERFHNSMWAGKRCLQNATQIWCHSGQVIQYYRKMPASNRPYWWSASIYRVALCMWAVALSKSVDQTGISPASSDSEVIAVDALPFNHPSIVRYLSNQDAMPVLSRSDGSIVRLRSPLDAVQQCIEVLKEETLLSQMDAIVCSRLSTFLSRWKIG